MSKRLLKFALSVVALGAAFSAYAQETTEPAVVTLSNGAGTVTWSQFVGALNGTQAPVNVQPLPATNSFSIALKDANTAKGRTAAALATANDELEEATTNKANAQAAYDAATSEDGDLAKAVSAAQTAYDNAVDAETTAKETYTDTKIAELKSTADASALKYNNQNQQVTDWRTELSTAKEDLNIANGNLATAIAAAGTQTASWLKTISDNARQFSTYFQQYDEWYDWSQMDEEDKEAEDEPVYTANDLKIWYYVSGTTIVVAYTQTSADYEKDTNNKTMTGPVGIPAFHEFLTSGSSSIKNVRVVLGKNYVDEESGNIITNGRVTAQSSNQSNRLLVPQTAVSAVGTVTSSNDYTEPKETADVKKYRGEVSQYNEQISDLNANINYWTVAVKDGDKVTTEGDPNVVGETRLETLKKQMDADQEAYDDANTAVSDAEAAVSAKSEALEAAKKAQSDAIATANSTLQAAIKTYNTAVTAQGHAKDDDDSAQIKVEAAQEAVTAEQNRIALLSYNEITLTHDVTVETSINTFSGKIHGGDNIINVPSGKVLFSTFSGSIDEVAINGKTYTTLDGGRFTNVARWDATNSNPGVYYGEGSSTNYASLGALGYAARAKFGVNFADMKLVDLADDTKVYNITTYEYDGEYETPSSQYVTISGDQFKSSATPTGFTLGANKFAKTATDDLTGFANVFYTDDNGRSTCANVEITDEVDFYCPVTLTATNLNYSREFKAGSNDAYGMNAVCLPFALNTSTLAGEDKAIRSICTFESVDNKAKKFWFINKGSTIAANTPVLLLVNKGQSLDKINLSGITIPKTTAQIKMDQGATTDGAQAYGLLKSVQAGEINGESNVDYIYGLNKNGNFQAARSSVTFKAFRMVISTVDPIMPLSAKKRAPSEYIEEYSIGVLDEDGNDILADNTSGIESVATDKASFNVTTAQGEIIIESEADYGKVDIYTIDGRLAAVANVTVGTTTVNVNAGVYIVLGKKVMVK